MKITVLALTGLIGGVGWCTFEPVPHQGSGPVSERTEAEIYHAEGALELHRERVELADRRR